MQEVFYVIAKTVEMGLGAIQLCMLLRMIMSIFVTEPEGNSFFMLLVTATELIVMPIRVIFDKLGVGQSSPFDWPFFVGYFLLIIAQSLLPVI